MSPNVEMICTHCSEVTIVEEILFLTNGSIEVMCQKCKISQVYKCVR